MKTVKEVSRLTGVSMRTLHHYDAIGLLEPTRVTDAGCTKHILLGLGQMYIAGDSMTENIDKAGGKGTAGFTNQAIDIHCQNP